MQTPPPSPQQWPNHGHSSTMAKLCFFLSHKMRNILKRILEQISDLFKLFCLTKFSFEVSLYQQIIGSFLVNDLQTPPPPPTLKKSRFRVYDP